MKPNFALDFRDTTLALLHRTPAGWRELGEVAMDAPDLDSALEYLRATAVALSRGALATKLLIPNSQILYTRIEAPGPDDPSRRAQIRAALEGRTPYQVDDLVFDWTGGGAQVQVAVIARETLEEAETFAHQHRLNPIGFAARAPAEDFVAEPWFGPSSVAANILAEGDRVEAERSPTVVIGRFDLVDGAFPSETPAGASAEAPADTETADAALSQGVLPDVDVERLSPTSARSEAQTDLAAEPAIADLFATDPAEPGADPIVARIAALPGDLPPDQPEPADLPPAEVPPAGAPDLPPPAPLEDPGPAPEPQPVPAYDPPPPARDPVPPQPSAGRDVLAAEPVFGEEAAVPGAVAPRLNIAMASVARQSVSGDPVPPTASAPTASTPPGPAPEAPMAVDVAPEDEDDLPPAPPGVAMAAFASRRPAVGPALRSTTPPPSPQGTARTKAAAAGRSGQKPQAAGPVTTGPMTTGPVTSPTISGVKKRKPVVTAQTAPPTPMAQTSPALPVKPAAMTAATAPGTRLTTGPFGGPTRGERRGKPRYLGLILTVALLVVLALVAAWASYTAAIDGKTQPAGTASVGTGTAPADVPTAEDEAAADLQPSGASGETSGDPAADLPPDTATAEGTGADADGQTAIPSASGSAEDQAETAPAPESAPATAALGSGSPAAAPKAAPQDEIFVATADAPPVTGNPGNLLTPEGTADAAPGQTMAPPPYGAVYKFDAEGRIVPTAQGVVTPDGVMLIAGKPSILPPPRSAKAIAAAAALGPAADAAQPAPGAAVQATLQSQQSQPAEAAALDAQLAAAPLPPPDPELAKARPKLRPAAMLREKPDDGAAVVIYDGPRIAKILPKPRTAAALAGGAAAKKASASLMAQNSASKVPEGGLEVSQRPAPRPRDLSRAVEAAVAAAVRSPDPVPPPAAQPDPAPQAPVRTAVAQPSVRSQPQSRTELEADDEPDLTGPGQKAPVKASVAKQATFANAINLSKVNLIGVYGTSSNRYALVRQPNGRYTKVQVGDTVDGGRVAAITPSEVRYQKSGRLLTLTLPDG